jgi:hypothetical protein
VTSSSTSGGRWADLDLIGGGESGGGAYVHGKEGRSREDRCCALLGFGWTACYLAESIGLGGFDGSDLFLSGDPCEDRFCVLIVWI